MRPIQSNRLFRCALLRFPESTSLPNLQLGSPRFFKMPSIKYTHISPPSTAPPAMAMHHRWSMTRDRAREEMCQTLPSNGRINI